jgi:hypothetical protein
VSNVRLFCCGIVRLQGRQRLLWVDFVSSPRTQAVIRRRHSALPIVRPVEDIVQSLDAPLAERLVTQKALGRRVRTAEFSL